MYKSCVLFVCRAVVCLLVVLGSIAGCAGSSAEVVASVDGATIVKSSLEHQMTLEVKLDAGRVSSRLQRRASALSFLIRAQWTLAQARELGISVSDAQVKQNTEILKLEQLSVGSLGAIPRRAELRPLLASPKVGFSDQAAVVKLSMLDTQIDALWQKQAAARITRAQIEDYYKLHQQRFHVVERRDVGIVESFQKSAMLNAEREIMMGKSFAVAAKRWSIDPLARDGTFNTSSNQGAKALREAIFGAKLHQLVGPLRVSSYYLFEVLRIAPAHELLLPPVEARIVRMLAAQQAAAMMHAAYSSGWKSRTGCKAEYAVAQCGV
jgi:SurA N-terminal domain/PPIC-type PPIASE domain